MFNLWICERNTKTTFFAILVTVASGSYLPTCRNTNKITYYKMIHIFLLGIYSCLVIELHSCLQTLMIQGNTDRLFGPKENALIVFFSQCCIYLCTYHKCSSKYNFMVRFNNGIIGQER